MNSIRQLSSVMGVPNTTLQRIMENVARDGGTPKRPLYEIATAVNAIIQSYDDQAEEESNRNRLDGIRADREEIKLNLERGGLISTQSVMMYNAECISLIAGCIDKLVDDFEESSAGLLPADILKSQQLLDTLERCKDSLRATIAAKLELGQRDYLHAVCANDEDADTSKLYLLAGL